VLDAFAGALLTTAVAISAVPSAPPEQAPIAIDSESSPPEGAPEPATEYSFTQSMIVPVGSGRTEVSAQAGNGGPRSGYFPMRVFIDNASGPREELTLVLSASDGGRRVTKSVELREGERRTVTMLVSTPFSGKLQARAPGVTQHGDGVVYLAGSGEFTVLSLSTEEEFQRAVGKAPSTSSRGFRVTTMPLEDAPSELAAYVGYDAVALPRVGLDALSEGVRRALEAYAATGGTVLAPHAGRGAAKYFPLTPIPDQRLTGYGLGRVMLCESCGSLGFGAVADAVRRHDVAVSPMTVNAAYMTRRRYGYDNEIDPLLPQAEAPIGTFLTIITLFTLLIGPGSIWVARKRGSAALLVTIPGTALVTCALIVGSSVLKDGFSIHASAHGYTELDSRGHRAITAGVTAYYANLSPSSAHFDTLTAVLSSNRSDEGDDVGIDWGESATAGSGFLPSRTYREWGYLTVTPTRARVIVKPGPDGPIVQNALGSNVTALTLSTEEGLFEVRDLRDGSEQVAQRVVHFSPPTMTANVDRRLGRDTRRRLGRPLDRGQFIAEVEGLGFLPSAGLTLDHHLSSEIVRGEFE
jgi:hypothetical protein